MTEQKSTRSQRLSSRPKEAFRPRRPWQIGLERRLAPVGRCMDRNRIDAIEVIHRLLSVGGSEQVSNSPFGKDDGFLSGSTLAGWNERLFQSYPAVVVEVCIESSPFSLYISQYHPLSLPFHISLPLSLSLPFSASDMTVREWPFVKGETAFQPGRSSYRPRFPLPVIALSRLSTSFAE